MTETQKQLVEETLQKICFKLFCENCKSIAVSYPLDIENQEMIRTELDQAIATATQQAVETERSRLQIKTAVNIMLTRLTPDECTEVMEKIYPEGILIRPEEREALSQKGEDEK